MILRGIGHVVSCFPLHFMFYRGNLDCFSNRVVYCRIGFLCGDSNYFRDSVVIKWSCTACQKRVQVAHRFAEGHHVIIYSTCSPRAHTMHVPLIIDDRSGVSSRHFLQRFAARWLCTPISMRLLGKAREMWDKYKKRDKQKLIQEENAFNTLVPLLYVLLKYALLWSTYMFCITIIYCNFKIVFYI